MPRHRGYIRPDTALDREAYARGTSVYFPDRAIPIMPEALSNRICSLNPNEDRLTKTICIEFNAKSEVIRSRFFIEGLFKLSSLTDDDYYEKEYVIKGRRHGRKFRLGDPVQVRVVRINAFRSEIDFKLTQAAATSRQ